MSETNFLWHQKLCHIHTMGMVRTSKVVNGLCNFSSQTDLCGFDLCFTLNLRQTSKGHVNTRRGALKVNQGIRIDWGFMTQKSHDKEITERLTCKKSITVIPSYRGPSHREIMACIFWN